MTVHICKIHRTNDNNKNALQEGNAWVESLIELVGMRYDRCHKYASVILSPLALNNDYKQMLGTNERAFLWNHNFNPSFLKRIHFFKTNLPASSQILFFLIILFTRLPIFFSLSVYLPAWLSVFIRPRVWYPPASSFVSALSVVFIKFCYILSEFIIFWYRIKRIIMNNINCIILLVRSLGLLWKIVNITCIRIL